MAIASVAEARAQYNANLDWQDSTASAKLALAAVRYLIVNRAQAMEDEGSSLNFASLETEKALIEKFLGVGAPRANGRSRRVQAAFQEGGIQ